MLDLFPFLLLLTLESGEISKHSDVGDRQDDTDIEVTVADRSANDSDIPNARRGCGAIGQRTLAHDRTGPDEANSGHEALQNARLTDRAWPEHGNRCLHQSAAAIATSGNVPSPAP